MAQEAPARRPDAPDEWHRVHPLTPFVRSWLLIVALAWGLGHRFLEDVVSALVKGEPVNVDVGGAAQAVGVGLLLAILCGIVGVMVGLGLLSWWFIRYQITEEHVRYRSGWLFRTQRQARLDRVQGIDIERRFLPRVLGLSSLKFDVADGGSSVLELSYLGRDHARQLREQLLAAALEAGEHDARTATAAPSDTAGTPGTEETPATAETSGTAGWPGAAAPGGGETGGAALPWAAQHHPGPDASATPVHGARAHGAHTQHTDVPGGEAGPARTGGATSSSGPVREGVDVRVARRHGLLGEQDTGRPVFTVPTGRVVLSLVCSPPAVVLLVVVLAGAVAYAVYPDALVVVVPVLLPLLLGVVSGLYSRVEKSWGFTLSEVPTGVRTRAGLFNEQSSTIPTGRVQALEITRPLLWRFFGGHRVTVTTAGKGGAADGDGLGSLVLPVGTAEQVRQALDLVLPLENTPRELVDEALGGSGPDGRFTTSPRRARWLDPLTWRRTGFAMDDAALVLRRGRLTRRASVVPHHKTQSAALSQGPLDRRMGLAGFTVHVTPGSVGTSVDHLDVEQVRALQWRHAELARAARQRTAGGPRTAPEAEGPRGVR